MACANGKETAFGRIHDYRICRVFQQSGRTRCPLNGDLSCPCFLDDGKIVEAAPHSKEDLEYLAFRERVRRAVIGTTVRRMENQLAPFFEGALSQMPDGGAAYYDSCNPFLPDPDFTARLADLTARLAFAACGR